ncbi:MAG TPA: triose-phosphate isomerase, partial [Rhizobiaceae bacterium]|nr:triose-phosphate isomerase [Rhizobiaceae bacterium]
QIAQSVPASAVAANTVLAYEPVWAIGTGLTPTAGDVAAAHAHIRAELAALIGGEAGRIRLLYGGSVKASNAAELLAVDHVDGALVGGASLKAADFLPIAQTYLSLSK